MQRPVIKDGVVVNVVEIEEGALWECPPGCFLGPPGAGIGHRWDGMGYIFPEISPPCPSPEEAVSLGLEATVRAILEAHPKDCIFAEGALDRILGRPLPTFVSGEQILEYANAALLAEEIYCPHEGIDRRAEFGLL